MTDTYDIAQIAQDLDDWYSALGRQFGPLSRPQRRMLRALDVEQAIRVSDLAEVLGLTTAGTTRMLDKLESLDYAVRARDLHSDQRQVYVRLTTAGKNALSTANAAFLSQVQTTLNRLDEGECATLALLLRAMNTRTSGKIGLSDLQTDL